MSFKEGTVICANCHRSREEHCQTCWSCQGEPSKECCMEGWPEASKRLEREYWARRAGAKS